jgi:hypothetical protein
VLVLVQCAWLLVVGCWDLDLRCGFDFAFSFQLSALHFAFALVTGDEPRLWSRLRLLLLLLLLLLLCVGGFVLCILCSVQIRAALCPFPSQLPLFAVP